MTCKFFRTYLFILFIPLIVGCGAHKNYHGSTKIEKEIEQNVNSGPEVEFDGNTYKIDGKPVKRVDRVCIPIEILDGDRLVRQLGTNVFLYVLEGEYVIGPRNTCKCMPNTARILISQGEKQIDNIQLGDSVFTFNNIDGKILVPIVSK